MILAYFGQNLVAIETCLKHLQSQMSYLDWPISKKNMLYVTTFQLCLAEMHL